MPAPTFVAEYETSDWDTNPSSKTVSVTASAGDRLVVLLGGSNGGGTYAITDGGGLTWTLQQSVHVSTSWADAWVWTASAGSAQTFDLTITKTGGSPVYGFVVLRFSGASGIGASSMDNVSASGATGVSLGITTTQADSVVAWLCADWDALSGASRAYLTSGVGTFTEQVYANSSFVTAYAGFHANAGAAGAKTVGLSAPTGQKYSIVAVEVLGAAGATQHAASGTVAVTSGATGSARSRLAATGSAAAVSATTASASRRLTAAGASVASSATSGVAAARLATSGAAHALTGASGSAALAFPASGSVDVVSEASGEATAMYAAGGTVDVVSGASGSANASGEPMMDGPRDITILSTTEPVTGWEFSGPISAWMATEPTKQTITTTEPASAWTTTEPEH